MKGITLGIIVLRAAQYVQRRCASDKIMMELLHHKDEMIY